MYLGKEKFKQSFRPNKDTIPLTKTVLLVIYVNNKMLSLEENSVIYLMSSICQRRIYQWVD